MEVALWSMAATYFIDYIGQRTDILSVIDCGIQCAFFSMLNKANAKHAKVDNIGLSLKHVCL